MREAVRERVRMYVHAEKQQEHVVSPKKEIKLFVHKFMLLREKHFPSFLLKPTFPLLRMCSSHAAFHFSSREREETFR